jgi:hypothetical protein
MVTAIVRHFALVLAGLGNSVAGLGAEKAVHKPISKECLPTSFAFPLDIIEPRLAPPSRPACVGAKPVPAVIDSLELATTLVTYKTDLAIQFTAVLPPMLAMPCLTFR